MAHGFRLAARADVDYTKLLKDIDFDWKQALDCDGDFKPELMAEGCRNAIQNWTVRMLTGYSFGIGGYPMQTVKKGLVWYSCEDAIRSWKEALDYWEAKIEEKNETLPT